LARSSHIGFWMVALTASTPLLSSGCLVADAPDYGPQQRTPPLIDPLSVDPKPGLFFTQDFKQTRHFSLKVYSEDAGEGLWAPLYVDYEDKDRRSWQIDYPLAPSTAENAKSLSFDWAPNGLIFAGCHSLTLLVMHESSYRFIPQREPIPKVSDGDIAQVIWWVTIPPEQPSDTVEACPAAETASGVDG